MRLTLTETCSKTCNGKASCAIKMLMLSWIDRNKTTYNCVAPCAVAHIKKPTQQSALPNIKNGRRPNRSLEEPARRKPSEQPVVKAGTSHIGQHRDLLFYERKNILNQYRAVVAPHFAPSVDCIAAVVGTGQKERPKVELRMKMTNHVFAVIFASSDGRWTSSALSGGGDALSSTSSCSPTIAFSTSTLLCGFSVVMLVRCSNENGTEAR